MVNAVGVLETLPWWNTLWVLDITMPILPECIANVPRVSPVGIVKFSTRIVHPLPRPTCFVCTNPNASTLPTTTTTATLTYPNRSIIAIAGPPTMTTRRLPGYGVNTKLPVFAKNRRVSTDNPFVPTTLPAFNTKTGKESKNLLMPCLAVQLTHFCVCVCFSLIYIKRVYGCNCTEGYWGDRCELRRDDPDVPDSYLQCRLQCQNGGVCREGLKDHGILHQYGGLNSITQNTSVLDPLDGGIEHCECPPGYAGVTCEHPIQVCGGDGSSGGGNNHVCLHGSQCVLQENQRDYKCECNTGNSNRNLQQQTPTAGAHCQHKASSICTTPLDDSGSLMFCVNGGNCQDEDHRHCDCPQGFLGK